MTVRIIDEIDSELWLIAVARAACQPGASVAVEVYEPVGFLRKRLASNLTTLPAAPPP